MILISIGKSKGFVTWVSYVDGYVIGRETEENTTKAGLKSSSELAKFMSEGFKETCRLLEPLLSTLNDRRIIVEVSSARFMEWVDGVINKEILTEVDTMLSDLNLLPFPVVFKLVKNGGTCADRYNAKDYVTKKEDVKLSRLVDLF